MPICLYACMPICRNTDNNYAYVHICLYVCMPICLNDMPMCLYAYMPICVHACDIMSIGI